MNTDNHHDHGASNEVGRASRTAQSRSAVGPLGEIAMNHRQRPHHDPPLARSCSWPRPLCCVVAGTWFLRPQATPTVR